VHGIHPVLALACGLLVAGGVHLAKSAVVRPFVTVSTAGTGNIPVSLAEDAASTAVSFVSIIVPLAVAGLAVILILFLLWWWARGMGRAQSA